MEDLVTEFFSVGLLGEIKDDAVLEKIDRAAAALAANLKEQPKALMAAMLAALDPAIPNTDPSVAKAKQALLAEWRSMLGVNPDPPIGLYRATLLEACNQCAEGRNALILWLVASDSVGLYRLGKEEKVIDQFLGELGLRAEEVAIQCAPRERRQCELRVNNTAGVEIEFGRLEKVDRNALLMSVAAAMGPEYKGEALSNDPNDHWQCRGTVNGSSIKVSEWNDAFTDRMALLLSNELDRLAEPIQSFLLSLPKSVQEVLADYEGHRRTEQLRLDALWWSEALYSPSLGKSYRELAPEWAALVMAADLLDVVSLPTPASVAHLLAETVQRLPEAGYNLKKPIGTWLEQLRQGSDKPALKLTAVPKEGRLSLRDVCAWASSDQTWDTAQALQRAGIEAGHEISLPALARALFRQEQACRLAMEAV